DDGHNGLVIQHGIVQTVQQMDSARPGRCEAYSHFASKFGVTTGHKGSHLFMPRLDEIYLIFYFSQSAHYPVDTIARISINTFYAPCGQARQHKIADSFAHD